MANAITLAKIFIPILDKIYKNASLTSVLDGNPELVRQGASYNEMIIPKIAMQGLADYSRNGGYVNGDVTLTNETVKCNFDRGRMFQVDSMDNLETAGIAFGQLAGKGGSGAGCFPLCVLCRHHGYLQDLCWRFTDDRRGGHRCHPRRQQQDG